MKLPSFYIAPHHTQVVSAGRNEELAEFAKHRLDSRLHATQTSRRKAVPELKVWIMWLYTIFTSVVIIVVVILIFIVITICCYYYDSLLLLLLLLLLQLVGWFDLVWFGLIDWHRSINQSINRSMIDWEKDRCGWMDCKHSMCLLNRKWSIDDLWWFIYLSKMVMFHSYVKLPKGQQKLISDLIM